MANTREPHDLIQLEQRKEPDGCLLKEMQIVPEDSWIWLSCDGDHIKYTYIDGPWTRDDHVESRTPLLSYVYYYVVPRVHILC